MTTFAEPLKDDFDQLLNLVLDFELDKQVSFEKSDILDRQKLFKERKKELKRFLADNTFKYILCKQENSLIGYIFLSFDNNLYEGEGYVNEIYIIPTQRRKGFAKKLLKKGLQWLTKNNCKTIDITVNRKNKAAIELYKQFGFDNYKDSYFPMRKTL